MSNTPDISRLVGLIMENPQLVEQISNLARAESNDNKESSEKVNANESTTVITEPAPSSDFERKNSTRGELLRAMKPYLSESRGRAIESMLSIAGILDVMKRG